MVMLQCQTRMTTATLVDAIAEAESESEPSGWEQGCDRYGLAYTIGRGVEEIKGVKKRGQITLE